MPPTALLTATLGQQTTFGTLITPTQKFMGVEEGSITILDTPEVPLVLGNLGPGPLTAQVAQSAEATLSGTATYEMLRYVYNGVFAATTAATSSGAIYPYNWTAPVTSTQAHKHYTLEFGTTGAAYTLTGATVSKFGLTGAAGGLWKFSAGFIGVDCSTSTGPTSLADTAATRIRVADTTLYVDVSTGTVGATAVNATLANFDFAYETGRHTKYFAGSLRPGDYGEGKHNATLKMTLEYNASAKAYIDELVGTTPSIVARQIRIQGSQGSSASAVASRIDFAGVMDGPPLFADRDGNVIVETNWRGYYSTALTNYVTVGINCASSQTP